MNALPPSLSYPPWQRDCLYLGLSTPQCQDAVHIFDMKLNLILALSALHLCNPCSAYMLALFASMTHVFICSTSLLLKTMHPPPQGALMGD